jgi:hypothetical protein
MTALLLCAALTADFEFETVSHESPKYRPVIQAIDRATQRVIADAPREIAVLRELAASETGAMRRKTQSQVRLYEHRLAELKVGKRAVYPRLPASLRVGDVGVLPGPMTVVRNTGAEAYLMEADWNLPDHNLIGLPIDARPSGGSGKFQFVYRLGPCRNNNEPLSAGTEFDLQNSMLRVIDVKDGIPVLEFASLAEPIMLEMLADYRRDLKKETPPAFVRRSTFILSN